ncbi:MAG: hypothetical protein R2784_00305 [Saprospiraceae bacterium]
MAKVTEALAFDNEQNTFEVKLNISGENANSFVMLQNQPNPIPGCYYDWLQNAKAR